MMHITKAGCNSLQVHDRYIVAFGSQVAVLDRKTLKLVRKFGGMRWIHGGVFVDDDTLMVFTGEQKMHFFRISTGEMLWTTPKLAQLGTSGDMRCCKLPDTHKIAAIAAGKDLDHHYLLIVDHLQKTVSSVPINCFWVVETLRHTPALGLHYLTYQAYPTAGCGAGICRIARIEEDGTATTLQEGVTVLNPEYCSDSILFLNEYKDDQQHLKWMFRLEPFTPFAQNGTALQSLPLFKIPGYAGERRMSLPSVSWVDEATGLLTAYSSKWAGIVDFKNDKILYDYQSCDFVYCAAVVDGRILIGTSGGVVAEPLDFLKDL